VEDLKTELPEPPKFNIVAQLVVNLLDNGRIMVQGEVIADAIRSYGMLRGAEHAIQDFHRRQAAQQRIEVVGAMSGLKVKE